MQEFSFYARRAQVRRKYFLSYTKTGKTSCYFVCAWVDFWENKELSNTRKLWQIWAIFVFSLT